MEHYLATSFLVVQCIKCHFLPPIALLLQYLEKKHVLLIMHIAQLYITWIDEKRQVLVE